MLKELFSNSGWRGKLFQLLLICLLFFTIGFLIWTIIFGYSNSLNSQKTLTFILSLAIFLFPVLFLSYFWYEKPVASLSLNKVPDTLVMLEVILLIISIQPFINFLSFTNEQLELPGFLNNIENSLRISEQKTSESIKLLLEATTFNGFILNIFLFAILPALSEELFFRGTMLNIFSEKYPKKITIWIVAAIFSVFHFQLFSFVPRLILGALLGYLLYWTKSIWAPILAHLVNNLIGVAVSYYSTTYYRLNDLDSLGKGDTFVFALGSGIVSAIILWVIYMQTSSVRNSKPIHLKVNAGEG